MLRKLGLVAVFIAPGLVACQPESDSVAGPQGADEVARPPLNSLPPSDGADPAVISYNVGETRVDSFTFDAPDASEINGNPWGVWFGTNEIVDDPPTPTGNDYWSMGWSHAHDWKSNSYSRLYFIPPVRRFSFTHATGLNQGLWFDEPPPDAFGYYVLDTAFHYVVQDSIRANGCPGLCVGATAQNNFTTRLDVSTGDEDRIHHVLFKGYMNIDDLVIVRAAQPGIVCDTVMRGDPATCSVIDTTGVTSVLEWRFEGMNEEGDPLTAVVNTTHDSIAWRGDVVASGSVSATLIRNGDTTVIAGPLAVEPRDWLWSEDDPNGAAERLFVPDGGLPCAEWGEGIVDQHGTPLQSFIYGLNTPAAGFADCSYNAILMPDPYGPSSPDGYELEQVQDAGPNDGIYFVASGSWHIRRGSLVNPFFLENGPAKELTKKPDQKACEDKTAIPGWASFWEYNEDCQGSSVAPFLGGIRNHEGVGTLGPDAAEPNGHWGRIDEKAREPSGDPYRAMEDVIDQNFIAVHERIRDKVQAVDDVLQLARDPFHINVHTNWCGLVFMYNGVHGRYDIVTPRIVTGACI